MKKRPFLSHSLEIRFHDNVTGAISLEAQMQHLFDLLGRTASLDPLLRPDRWLVSTGERESSYLYRAFDERGPTAAALAVLREDNKRETALKSFTLWNGEEAQVLRASIACLFDRQDGHSSSLTLNMDSAPDDFRLGDAANATGLVMDAVTIYKPLYCSLGPEQYDAVFPDRPGVAWMIYLRQAITAQQVPEARALVPVEEMNEKGKKIQTGTIVTSVTDAAFSDLNPEHVKVANSIEIRLVDQDLLPLYKEL